MITYFETEKDQEMFKKALMYNLYLTVGTKHPFEIEQLYQKIASKLIRVQTQSDITSTQLGKCIDLASGNQSLILKSEKDVPSFQRNTIQMAYLREISHAISNILATTTQRNGCLKEHHGCYVKVLAPNSGELKENYGTALNFMMHPIYAAVSAYFFERDLLNIHLSLEDILYHSEKLFDSHKEGYRLLATMTSLLIASFDNDTTIDYHMVVQNGDSPLQVQKKCANGKKLYKNDLLVHGRMNHDELERHFDEMCGQPGSYRHMCRIMDQIASDVMYYQFSYQKNASQIVEFMQMALRFFQSKLSIYLNEGYFTLQQRNQLCSHFNRIYSALEDKIAPYTSVYESSTSEISGKQYQKIASSKKY